MQSLRPRIMGWMIAGCLILVGGAAFAARRADPVAVLVQKTGAVQVQRSGQSPATAAVGTQLNPGDRVLVPNGGRAVILYKTGKMETATAAVVVADPQGAQSAGLFARTVKTLTEVATTDARTDPNRQGMIRPIAGAAVPIAPRNGIKVLDVRPTFQWFKIPDATGYVIQIRRADGMPVRYETGPDTSWTLPAGEPALMPGAQYEWTVAAMAGGRVAPLQRFQVAAPADYAAVAEALQSIAEGGLDPMSDGLFLAALAYRDAGLFYEARGALDRLAGTGAGAGRPFRLLRGEVLDALGDLEAASREFSLAESEPAT